MTDSNDPDGIAPEPDDETGQTAAIAELLGDSYESDDSEDETENNAAQTDEDDEDSAEDSDADDSADADEDGDQSADADQSDIEVILSNGQKLNRKQIEAAVEAEAHFKKAYTPKFQQIAEKDRALEAERQAITQQRQQFEQVLPFALGVLQKKIPPKPTEQDWERDYFKAQTQDRQHREATEEFGQLQAAYQRHTHTQQQQAAQASQQQFGQLKNVMLENLTTRRPELRDQAKFSAYEAELEQTLTAYGFEATDTTRIMDERLLRMFEDAGKYRQQQAKKPKAISKAQNAPPVAKPGVRTNGKGNKNKNDLTSKLRDTGDERFADALLANLM